MRPNLWRPAHQGAAVVSYFDNPTNRLIQQTYLLTSLFRDWLLQAKPANSYMHSDKTCRYQRFFDFADRKMPFARVNQLSCFADKQSGRDGRPEHLRAAVDLSFEPNTLR